MKTGIFKTKYRTAEGRFTCSWLMILGKCLFVKHKKSSLIKAALENVIFCT